MGRLGKTAVSVLGATALGCASAGDEGETTGGTLTYAYVGTIYRYDVATGEVSHVREGHQPSVNRAGELVWLDETCVGDDGDFACDGWSVRVDGEDGEAVVCGEVERAGNPTLSDDGAWMAHVELCDGSEACGGEPDWEGVTVRARDGGGVGANVQNGVEAPAWSADRRLAFHDAAGGRLFTTDAAVSLLYAYETGMSAPAQPSWSPDGATVAFAGDDEVYALDVATGEFWAVTELSEPDVRWPAYSPDGSWIVFSQGGDDDATCSVHVVPAGGGDVLRLTDASGQPLTADCDSRVSWN